MKVRLGAACVVLAFAVSLAVVQAIEITLGEKGAASRVVFDSGEHHYTIFSPAPTVTAKPLPARALEMAKQRKGPNVLPPPPKAKHSFLELDDAATATADDAAAVMLEMDETGKPAPAAAKKATPPAVPATKSLRDYVPKATPATPLSRTKFDRSHAYTTHNTFALSYRKEKPRKAPKKQTKKPKSKKSKGKYSLLEIGDGDSDSEADADSDEAESEEDATDEFDDLSALIELDETGKPKTPKTKKKQPKSKKERVVFLIESSKPYLPYLGPPVPARRHIPTIAEKRAADAAHAKLIKTVGKHKADAIKAAADHKRERAEARKKLNEQRDREAKARAAVNAAADAEMMKAREPVLQKLAGQMKLSRDELLKELSASDFFGDNARRAKRDAKEKAIRDQQNAADSEAEKKAAAIDKGAIKAASVLPPPPGSPAAEAAAAAKAAAATVATATVTATATVPAPVPTSAGSASTPASATATATSAGAATPATPATPTAAAAGGPMTTPSAATPGAATTAPASTVTPLVGTNGKAAVPAPVPGATTPGAAPSAATAGATAPGAAASTSTASKPAGAHAAPVAHTPSAAQTAAANAATAFLKDVSTRVIPAGEPMYGMDGKALLHADGKPVVSDGKPVSVRVIPAGSPVTDEHGKVVLAADGKPLLSDGKPMLVPAHVAAAAHAAVRAGIHVAAPTSHHIAAKDAKQKIRQKNRNEAKALSAKAKAAKAEKAAKAAERKAWAGMKCTGKGEKKKCVARKKAPKAKPVTDADGFLRTCARSLKKKNKKSKSKAKAKSKAGKKPIEWHAGDGVMVDIKQSIPALCGKPDAAGSTTTYRGTICANGNIEWKSASTRDPLSGYNTEQCTWRVGAGMTDRTFLSSYFGDCNAAPSQVPQLKEQKPNKYSALKRDGKPKVDPKAAALKAKAAKEAKAKAQKTKSIRDAKRKAASSAADIVDAEWADIDEPKPRKSKADKAKEKDAKAAKSKAEAKQKKKDAAGGFETIIADPDAKQQPAICRWAKKFPEKCVGTGKNRVCKQKICSRKRPNRSKKSKKSKKGGKPKKADKSDKSAKSKDAKDGKSKSKKSKKSKKPKTRCVIRTCRGPGAGQSKKSKKSKDSKKGDKSAVKAAADKSKDDKSKKSKSKKAKKAYQICTVEKLWSDADKKAAKAAAKAAAHVTEEQLRQEMLRSLGLDPIKGKLTRAQRRELRRRLRRARKARTDRDALNEPPAPAKRILSWDDRVALEKETPIEFERRLAEQRADDAAEAEEKQQRRIKRIAAEKAEAAKLAAERDKQRETLGLHNNQPDPQLHPVPTPPPVTTVDLDAISAALRDGPKSARPIFTLPEEKPATPTPAPAPATPASTPATTAAKVATPSTPAPAVTTPTPVPTTAATTNTAAAPATAASAAAVPVVAAAARFAASEPVYNGMYVSADDTTPAAEEVLPSDFNGAYVSSTDPLPPSVPAESAPRFKSADDLSPTSNYVSGDAKSEADSEVSVPIDADANGLYVFLQTGDSTDADVAERDSVLADEHAEDFNSEYAFEQIESDADVESDADADTDADTDTAESELSREMERNEVERRRFTGHVHALRANITGNVRVRAPTLVLGGVNQWALVAHDSFDGKLSPKRRGWSDGRRSTCNSKDQFLGGYCQFADTKVTKTFHRLPVHTHLRVSARFHFFDRWEGQYAYAMINDRIVWVQNHRHCTSIFSNHCKGIDICGDSSFSDRLSTAIDVTISHDSRPLHPRLAPIELRVLGLKDDPSHRLAVAHRAHLAAEAASKAAAAKAKLPKLPASAIPPPVPTTGTPSLVTDPAATNRFVDIESDDDGLSLAGEPLPVTNSKHKKAGGKPSDADIVFALPNYNNTDTVTITFGAVMPGTDPCVASWGVDDIQIFAMMQKDDPRYD